MLCILKRKYQSLHYVSSSRSLYGLLLHQKTVSCNRCKKSQLVEYRLGIYIKNSGNRTFCSNHIVALTVIRICRRYIAVQTSYAGLTTRKKYSGADLGITEVTESGINGIQLQCIITAMIPCTRGIPSVVLDFAPHTFDLVRFA